MKKFLIIDSHGLIHRAFHALPPFVTAEGEPVGAIYGLATMVLKITNKHNPDYIVAAFDRPEPTFRKELFEEYKAHRPPAPDDLISQFKEARKFFEAIQIPVLEYPGFEADDIIGTLVKKYSKEELSIVILTGDLDTLQLVRDGRVFVETPQKGSVETKTYDEKMVEDRFGVRSDQLIDYKGLVGDPSDNIPGVPGIGQKTAAKILKKFGTIENVFKNIGEKDPILKKLAGHKEKALFSKKLATIRTDVPLEGKIEDFVFKKRDEDRLISYFKKLGFQSLIKRLGLPVQEVSKEKQGVFVGKNKESFFVYTKNGDLEKLEKEGVLKIAFDWKKIIKDLPSRTCVAKPIFDIRIAAWLLNPENKIDSLDVVSETFLEKKTGDEWIDLENIYLILSKKLAEEGLLNIFNMIEMPLIEVLAEMEQWGILINKKKLRILHKKILGETNVLAENIYKTSGEVFNINSPQQVGDIVFNKLKVGLLKKRTPTGKLKTGKGVLEEIKNKHPVIPLLLKYREYFKINSGFVLPLLELAEKDGRIHTTYLQTGTATGRISSEKPNLQNIPQESRWSENIRNVFEASPKKTLVSFDYSQIELRILAHLSKDDGLLRAFRENKDIHSLTAMGVFGVAEKAVTKTMRRVGKTLNFGVIYGMGPRAFSKTSGVSVEEAKKIIENYFKNFPKVKTWQNEILQNVKENHYIKNTNGRKRWFKTENSYTGEFERAAVNMPIQSLEADIIKKAMIETREVMLKNNLWEKDVRLLLSIHDELLFEISDDILSETVLIIKKTMESLVQLSAPLVVEIKRGKQWGRMDLFF